jgi:Domain of unknown function (DUF4252)
MKIATILLVAVTASAWAQDIKMPANLDKLAANADETVDVTLDGAMLKLAGRFVSGKGDEEAKTKKALSGIESITVKSFEFSREGQYQMADVDAIRAQVKGPTWARIVGVTSKRDGENVDVYFKDAGNGNLGGILVLCVAPKEVTIVSIVGTLDPSQLADLDGHFGIPKLNLGMSIHGREGGK